MLNKRSLESLILSGCFDSLGPKRVQLEMIHERAYENAVQAQKRASSGQMSFFDSAPDSFGGLNIPLPDIEEYSPRQRLAFEKQVTGLYISGHPLQELERVLSRRPVDVKTIADSMIEGATGVSSAFEGRTVSLVGIITDVHKRRTKQKRQMADIVLEDLRGQMTVLIFPDLLLAAEDLIVPDQIVEIRGKVSVSDNNEPELLASSVTPFEGDDQQYLGKQLFLRIPKAGSADEGDSIRSS